MSFVPQDLINRLDSISRDELDRLNIGVVKLDSNGIAQIYNKVQGDLAGFSAADVEGKNWFTQVALCTNNRICYGRFKKGVSTGELDEEFNYTFTYKMKPTNVVIRLYKENVSNSYWAFIKSA